MTLLEAVRAELYVEQPDERTDARLTGYIERGKARLQTIAGKTLDFDQEGEQRRLLLDYCRYANSQALEMFERNFSGDLLSLHLNSQVVIPDEDQTGP